MSAQKPQPLSYAMPRRDVLRAGDVGALQLMADALADSGIQRLTRVNWQARDRWGDTPLQVCVCVV